MKTVSGAKDASYCCCVRGAIFGDFQSRTPAAFWTRTYGSAALSVKREYTTLLWMGVAFAVALSLAAAVFAIKGADIVNGAAGDSSLVPLPVLGGLRGWSPRCTIWSDLLAVSGARSRLWPGVCRSAAGSCWPCGLALSDLVSSPVIWQTVRFLCRSDFNDLSPSNLFFRRTLEGPRVEGLACVADRRAELHTSRFCVGLCARSIPWDCGLWTLAFCSVCPVRRHVHRWTHSCPCSCGTSSSRNEVQSREAWAGCQLTVPPRPRIGTGPPTSMSFNRLLCRAIR